LGGILVGKQEGSVWEISKRWYCGLSEELNLKKRIQRNNITITL
jgi:hypothetical protein